jgi:hypothetical protein
MLYKICKSKVDFKSKEWRDYILWRNYNFSTFDSLDSKLRKSFYKPSKDNDYEHTLINNGLLTDITDSLVVAKRLHDENGGLGEILQFDFATNKESPDEIIGYDILDGYLTYSLLTNYGNNLDFVNNCLCKNGLIRTYDQAKVVHQMLISKFPNDGHTEGSTIFRVYKFKDY